VERWQSSIEPGKAEVTETMTRYDRRPGTATEFQVFRRNSGQDPARYLVPDSELYHPRPSIQAGDDVFVWPVGTEGFRLTGNATLGIHHYIGDDDVDVQVMHRSERRIELSGAFPGRTSAANREALETVLRKPVSDPGKILYLPGILERVQYVELDNYEFSHDAEDRTHSIEYSVTLVRMGTGRRIADPHGKPAPPNPGQKHVGKGKKHKYVIVKAGLRTFRQIAKKVYGNPEKWPLLMAVNMSYYGNKLARLPNHQVPTYRWPLGTHIYF
jgi:hypothetical protein